MRIYTPSYKSQAYGLAFKYYDGHTQEIVFDQDMVMVVAENAGNRF